MDLKHFKSIADGLLHLFYPVQCEGCGHTLTTDERTLCLRCTMLLPRTGYHHLPDNNTSQHFIGRVPVERATSFVYFTKQGLVQHLLHRLKYNRRVPIGNYLGNIFASELKKCNWTDTIDAIVPVPLHYKKEQRRGFNQAKSIAEGLSGGLKIRMADKVLKRTRNTASQTHKTRAERLENVTNGFKVIAPEYICRKHLLLVDDVLTTGATLEACATALLKVPGVKVSIATLALALD
jgi:ComF family protein